MILIIDIIIELFGDKNLVNTFKNSQTFVVGEVEPWTTGPRRLVRKKMMRRKRKRKRSHSVEKTSETISQRCCSLTRACFFRMVSAYWRVFTFTNNYMLMYSLGNKVLRCDFLDLYLLCIYICFNPLSLSNKIAQGKRVIYSSCHL